MKQHFEKLKFAFTWRDYQSRVLGELENHLEDNHLHIVAAPGSGKTVLGIEVMRRLAQPALVLAPTITIRNQWIDRLDSMFMCQEEDSLDWISADVRRPKFLTIITYQALNAAFSLATCNINGEIEEADAKENCGHLNSDVQIEVVESLQAQNVKTLVLDEAHHLRKEWWRSLIELKVGLQTPTIVALTATPPYDVDLAEWYRYELLCGPIDTEISVPELVKHEDLCPHQDYVFFSLPTPEELKRARQFTADIGRFIENLQKDEEFISIISSHKWLCEPESHIEDILSDPQFFSALIIYLTASGIKVSKNVLSILGVRRKHILQLDAKWLEIFFTKVLITELDQFADYQNKLEEVYNELKRIGGVERRKVVIENTKTQQKMLASSLGKLNSIKEVTALESQCLGNKLRMVILTDYIRKNQLNNTDATKPIKKIGVVPIFQYLDRANMKGIRLGILTGSLVIIPTESISILERVLERASLPSSVMRTAPLRQNAAYSRIELKGVARKRMVSLITDVFNEGGITVLVGTQALLGEGWDAPPINTLVLASFVGSYMLSNQMRGRAIRVDPRVPEKTANIWHLVAIDLESVQEKIKEIFLEKIGERKAVNPFDEVKENLGDDMLMMRRRFRAFEGLTHHSPYLIENGIKRLRLADIDWSPEGVNKLNRDTIKIAQERDELQGRWNNALQGISDHPKMHEKVETNYVPKALSIMDTLEYLVLNALMVSAIYFEQVINATGRNLSKDINLYWFLIILLIVPLFYTLPKLIKALYIFLRNGTVENSMRQVGLAVADALCNADVIKTSRDDLIVIATKEELGAITCKITGSTVMERRSFLNSMEQVLGPIDNPKYLLIRRTRFGFIERTDYHSVPKLIGQKKENAKFFVERWKKLVGKSELVYTRTREGRQILLRARSRSMASAFQKKTDRISVWE